MIWADLEKWLLFGVILVTIGVWIIYGFGVAIIAAGGLVIMVLVPIVAIIRADL